MILDLYCWIHSGSVYFVVQQSTFALTFLGFYDDFRALFVVEETLITFFLFSYFDFLFVSYFVPIADEIG